MTRPTPAPQSSAVKRVPLVKRSPSLALKAVICAGVWGGTGGQRVWGKALVSRTSTLDVQLDRKRHIRP